MATFNFTADAGARDMDALLGSLQMTLINDFINAPSSALVQFSNGQFLSLTGSGMSITGPLGAVVFSGTVSSATIFDGLPAIATLTLSNVDLASLFNTTTTLFDGDDTINGNGSASQSLYGYGGNDVLTMTDGSVQDADSLYGGEGDDRFQIDYVPSGFNPIIGPNDAIFGGAGTDTLWLNMDGFADFSVVPTLPQEIEVLRITSNGGPGLLTLNGSMGILNTPGLTGVESVWQIQIDAAGTYDFSGLTFTGAFSNGFAYPVIFSGSAGNDAIIAPLAYIGTSAHDYSGAVGNDTITGNASNERMFGGDGLDQLTGGGGNDSLNGNNDADGLFGGTGVDSLSGGQGADTLSGGDDADTINGDNGSDSLLGGNGDDAITGDSGVVSPDHGDDTLNGGAGADTLIGAGGNDIYVTDALDTIAELAGAENGVDTVQIAASASLLAYANIENLTLIGSAAIDGAGNAGTNVITGNAAANYLTGGGGVDTLQGAGGGDTYLLAAGVTIIEAMGAGTDTALTFTSGTLATNVERLILLGDSDINGTGNAGANRITGNDGDNRLDGGAGGDRLIGGAGDDTYVFGLGDMIVEYELEGTDTVESSVSIVLSPDLERVVLTGTSALNATGNALANRITGNTAANILDGGDGIDTLIGGAGNDTYLVDDAADVVTELGGATTDIVRASVTYALAGNLNIDTLAAVAGNVAINLSGNALAQTLQGNAGANVLNGSTGMDTLTGGGGADTFVFTSVLGATNVDLITDFSRAMDIMHLQNSLFVGIGAAGALAAGVFASNATGLAGDTTDRIIYETDTGIIRYDSNGSTAGGTQVTFARLQTPLALDHTDFLVI